MDEHVHFPPIYGRSIKLRNSEERQLMKWVGIFQVGLFLGGNNPGAGGGNFPRGNFPRTEKKKIRRLRSQILTCLVFTILLSKKNTASLEKVALQKML